MSDVNVMVDLETLSQSKTAAIVSIGAVKFDGVSILDEFYVNIDPLSCKAHGLDIQIQTIQWWKTQKPEAYASLKNNRTSLEEALDVFSSWFGPTSLPVWGNGVSFDNVILENAYIVLNKKVPWKYYDERCYRTVVNLFGISKIKSSARTLHHNALDDAKAQALNLMSLFSKK